MTAIPGHGAWPGVSPNAMPETQTAGVCGRHGAYVDSCSECQNEEPVKVAPFEDGVAVAFTMDQVGCARCHGDGHPGLRFEPLTFPVEAHGCEDFDLTHWAPCPTNGEPILFAWVKVAATEETK